MSRVALDPRRIYDQLRRDGWRIELTRRMHIKCFSPCGKHLIIASGSFEGPSADNQSIRNFLRDLKRAGWTPPE